MVPRWLVTLNVAGGEGYDSKRWAFGVRFFDSAVREVGEEELGEE